MTTAIKVNGAREFYNPRRMEASTQPDGAGGFTLRLEDPASPEGWIEVHLPREALTVAIAVEQPTSRPGCGCPCGCKLEVDEQGRCAVCFNAHSPAGGSRPGLAAGTPIAPHRLMIDFVGQCNKCQRKTTVRNEVGKRCRMTQPDGRECGGYFQWMQQP